LCPYQLNQKLLETLVQTLAQNTLKDNHESITNWQVTLSSWNGNMSKK